MHDELECQFVKGMLKDSETETDDHGGMHYPDRGIRKLSLRQNPGKDEVCYSTESSVFSCLWVGEEWKSGEFWVEV